MATRVKTGGRTSGSLDLSERKLLTARYAKHIDQVYMKLGGPKFLLTWAQDNPSEFIKQCWSRIAPAFQKDEADVQINQQFVSSDLSEREAAVRIAFALSKAAYQQGRDITPQQACHVPSPEAMPLLQPEPIEDPERQRWVEDLQLSDSERRQKVLIEDTKTGIYYGSAAEQGLSPARRRRRDQLL